MNIKNIILIITILPIIFFSSGCTTLPSLEMELYWDPDEHELMVYSIYNYHGLLDAPNNVTKEWKDNIGGNLGDHKDPYQDFWQSMCEDSAAASNGSYRRNSLETTVHSMVSTNNGWADADMVFFFGHVATIPPGRHKNFGLWEPYQLFADTILSWTHVEVDYYDWGTTTLPYMYHADKPITDVKLDPPGQKAYAIFYAYHPLTSVLIGRDFIQGLWRSENTWNQDVMYIPYSHRLTDTEWIFAHGCRGVVVADDNGSQPSTLGVSAWKDSWYRLHMVLGCYAGTYVISLPDLNEVAADLKAGVPIKKAYFKAHDYDCYKLKNEYPLLPEQPRGFAMPAVISRSPKSCCSTFGDFLFCPPFGCEGDYMDADRWMNWMPDPTPANEYYYSVSWKVPNLFFYPTDFNSEQYPQFASNAQYSSRSEIDYKKWQTVSKVTFASYRHGKLKQLLRVAARKLLGHQAKFACIMDHGDVLSLRTRKGVAWIARDTGAFSVSLSKYNRGPTTVRDADEAIRLAISQFTALGVLKVSEQEIIEPLAVHATHYAGWSEMQNGKLVPVHFGDEKESVTQFASEYTVYFARRYRGIPIYGPALSVTLDADGHLVSFRKGWRDIVGEAKVPIEILSPQEIEALRDKKLQKKFDFIGKVCGYFEFSGVGYHQESPGVGCRYVYRNPLATEPLAEVAEDLVNISKGGKPAIGGKRLLFKRPPSQGKSDDR